MPTRVTQRLSTLYALKHPVRYLHSKRWLERGRWLQRHRDSQEAVEAYHQALRHEPPLVEIWLERGLLWESLGKPAQAQTDYEHALRLDPSEPMAWLGLVTCLQKRFDHTQAIATLERAFSHWPEAAWLWCEYARALQLAHREAEAFEAANRAIALNPWEYKALKLRASYYFNNDRFALAIPDYEAILGISEKFSQTHAKLGFSCYYLGDYTRALAEADLADQYDPRRESGGLLRLRVLLESGDFEQALLVFKQLRSEWLEEHQFEMLLEIYLRMGRLQQALAETEARLADDPPYYHLDRAQVLALMGELGAARDDLDTYAAALSHPEALLPMYELQGWIALYAGEPDAAQAAFRRSLDPALPASGWHLRTFGRAFELRKLLPVKLKPLTDYQDLPAYARVRECLQAALDGHDGQALQQAYDQLAELGRQWLARAKRR